jgi:tyrocidine synthetase III
MNNNEQQEPTGLEVAVIGLSVRFPGAANARQFLANLKAGKESIRFFTVEELADAGIDHNQLKDPNYVRAKGQLDNAEYFDAGFFGYTPAEATVMDPQMRLFHCCTWEALEDAGYDPGTYDGLIGLYGGASSNQYWQMMVMLAGGAGGLDPFSVLQLTNKDNLTTLVSYNLNLKGPSYLLQTACSTSLVAVHVACQALLSGECSIALAGGVTVMYPRETGYMYQEGMVSSPDGHCRAFDAAARGTVGGEGCGIVALKLLEYALDDGDHIHAVIKGSAINNDGKRKTGYTAPSIKGQVGVIKAAHKMAEIDAESIGYIEAHGTATVLGDPIEIESLKQAFDSPKHHFCAVGSVKTNFGHLDSAAGIAGFIKTLLSLKEQQIFPSLHFKTPNPKIDFDNSPFFVPQKPCPWPNRMRPLRAGVSSFGVGGTNAHIILEEAPIKIEQDRDESFHLLLLSARSEKALKEVTQSLVNHFQTHHHLNLDKVAYTLQVGRKAFSHRKTVVCKSAQEAIERLSVQRPLVHAQPKNKVIFMFSGLGAQYVDMALDLYKEVPLFHQQIDNCFGILKPLLGYDIKEVIYPGESKNSGLVSRSISDHDVSQPLIFSIEYSLAWLLMQLGIAPHAMIGYSFGEFVAATVAGVFSLADALKIIVSRGRLVQQLPEGAMLSVPLPKDQLLPLLSEQSGLTGISIGIDNGSACIVSGPLESIKSFQKQMKSKRLLCMLLGEASHALHSPAMVPILDEFAAILKTIKLNEPQVPYISNVTGEWISQEDALDPLYWCRHLSQTVSFDQGMRHLVTISGALFIEIGPGRDLATMVKRYLDGSETVSQDKPRQVVNLIRNPMKQVHDMRFLLNRLGYLWGCGVAVDWHAFYNDEIPGRISLPTYPFQEQRYTIDPSGKLLILGQKMFSGTVNLEATEQLKEIRQDSDAMENLLPEEPVHTETPSGQRPFELETSYVAPCNDIETRIVNIWQSYFGIQPIGIEDDFFELGGDSLKAMNVSNLIQKELDVDIPVAEFFSCQTIKDLAMYVNDNIGKTKSITITSAEVRDYYPLSPAQKRLYVLQQMETGTTAYNEPIVVQLEGALDFPMLEETFNQLILRHESLRTSIHVIDGELVQQIHDQVPFETQRFYPDDPAQVMDIINDFVRPFDPSKAPLLRVGLVDLGEDHYVLAIDMPHIISDGTSQTILIKDFMALYGGATLSPLPVQYKDYALLQNQLIQSGQYRSHETFWKEQFSGDIPQLSLPYDFPRPSVFDYQGSKIRFEFSPEETNNLNTLASQEGVTLFMLLTALSNVFFAKLSNQEDIIIGSPIAGRRHVDLQQVLGVFINTLALRNFPLREKPFNLFLSEVKTRILQAYDNQDYPFDDLVNKVVTNRDTSRNPLMDVMLVLQNMESPNVEIPGLKLKPFGFEPGISRFDLVLTAMQGSDGLHVSIEYSTRLFTAKTIERFILYFRQLVRELTRSPRQRIGEIDMIPQSEKEQLLYGFNETEADYPHNKTIHQLFQEQVVRTPEHIALTVPGADDITYDRLNRQANRLAHYLIKKGVRRNNNRVQQPAGKKGVRQETSMMLDPFRKIVPLLLEPSIDMIIAILAILKAGGAYLPIDSQVPIKRINAMLEDCAAPLVLSDHDVDCGREVIRIDQLTGLDQPGFEINPETNVSANDLAYIIFTSGSTGMPKGVMIEHRNVVRLMINDRNPFDFNDRDVWTLFHSYSFDFSVWEMYGPLLYGGRMVIVPNAVRRDPEQFLTLLEEQSVTVLNQTPSAFYALITQAMLAPVGELSIRYIIFGGEALNPAKLKPWYQQYPHVRLINMYGITETTVHVTFKEIGEKEIQSGISNIGVPIPTLSVYILDSGLNLVPIGVPGELCVGGAGVARGYLNRPELTTQSFLIKSFWESRTLFTKRVLAAGGNLYRSGDLVRWLVNGEMEYLGRIDHQVKVRGFRIELGEIESRLLRHEIISEVVVLAAGDDEESRSLRAYIVSDSSKSLEVADLRRYLAEDLPDYMIPAYFITVPGIPLTPNGKVDRKALIALKSLDSNEKGIDTHLVAPANDTQRQLVSIWQQVLEIESVSITDNFFNVGGDSIKAIKLVHLVNNQIGSDLKIPDLYINETIKKLAVHITQLSLGVTADEVLDIEYSVLREMDAIRDQVLSNHPLSGNIEDAFPMSDIEKGMVFHSLKDKGSVYHDQFPYPMHYSSFDFNLFKQALLLMVKKHANLRTGYNVDMFAEPVRIVYKDVPLDIRYQDISPIDSSAQEVFLRHYMSTDRQHPFNTSQAPLWRMRVFYLGDELVWVLWVFHHAMIDGWSNASLVTELNNTYLQLRENRDYLPTDLSSTYKDFIKEQMLEKRNPETIQYWTQELEEYKRLRFPTPSDIDFETETDDFQRLVLTQDSQLLERVEKSARQHNTSIKHLFFAAYVYMLNMLSYENDLVTGLVTNNRPVCLDGEKIVGCFLNTVPIRVRVPMEVGFSWAQYIRFIDETLKNLTRYNRLSLYEIVQITGKDSHQENPFFDALFNFTDFHVYNKAIGDDTADETVNWPKVEEYENTNTLFDFGVHVGDGTLRFVLSYSRTLLDPLRVERLSGYFLRLLEMFIDSPQDLMQKDSILSIEEKKELTGFLNGTSTTFPEEKSIVQLFVEQAQKKPDGIAVIDCEEEAMQLSYRQLDECSNQIAADLIQKGVWQENNNNVVGLMVDRSVETIVTILAILKSGAAYLPIDPSYPQERIDYMLRDSGAVLHRAHRSHRTYGSNVLPKGVGGGEALAYVIYTSGSTGRPKGVMIEHRNVVNLVAGLDNILYDQTQGLRVALVAPFVFDASVQQIFAALLLGQSLCIVPEENRINGFGLVDYYYRQSIDISDGTPTHIKLMTEALSSRKNMLPFPVRHFLIGGEALLKTVVQEFRACFGNSAPAITNVYGPSECCVDSSFYHIPLDLENHGDVISIGNPMPNESIFILDKQMHQQPVGVAGELCITGEGVGRGYLNNPGLTEKMFFCHGRTQTGTEEERGIVYKTGDLARWMNDGTIEFLGRLDFQVKVRGYRIELGEIESQLRQYLDIKDAVVTVGQGKTPSLCAYVVSEKKLDITGLRGYLAGILPAYMIPSYFVFLEQLPLTASGKLDRRSLPEPQAEAGYDYIAPTDNIERQLSTVMQEVLEIERIGLGDNFFEMGGDSIKAIQVSSRLQSHGLKLEIKDLLSNPKLKEMASCIKPLEQQISQASVTGVVPLTPIQKSFFQKWETGHYRLNQAVLLFNRSGFDEHLVEQVFKHLVTHHDALRMTFNRENDNDTISQQNQGLDAEAFNLETVDLREVEIDKQSAGVTSHSEIIQASIDPFNGPLMRLGLFKTHEGDHLLIAVHHLVVDGISWRILLEDLGVAFGQAFAGEAVSLPAKSHAFKTWAEKLVQYSISENVLAQLDYWKGIESLNPGKLTTDFQVPAEEKRNQFAQTAVMGLNETETEQLLREVNQAYHTEINDILLTALVFSFYQWQGLEQLAVHLEGHGREPMDEPLDVGRTVGWFTTQYPVVLDIAANNQSSPDMGAAVKQIKETLRQVPDKGLGYDILKYLTPNDKRKGLVFELEPEISFNYLGQFSNETGNQSGSFQMSPLSAGNTVSTDGLMHYKIDINGMIANGKLTLVFTYNTREFDSQKIQKLADLYKSQLRAIIHHCMKKEDSEKTLSDYTVTDFDQEEMDTLFDVLEDTFA